MPKKRYRIRTALTRKYSKTKRSFTKQAKKIASIRALKKTSMRVKKRLMTLVHKTKQSVKRMTSKVDHTVAKKIRSIMKRR
jgi:flagellar biosynthesis/type III secretory pathway protein FliH